MTNDACWALQVCCGLAHEDPKNTTVMRAGQPQAPGNIVDYGGVACAMQALCTRCAKSRLLWGMWLCQKPLLCDTMGIMVV